MQRICPTCRTTFKAKLGDPLTCPAHRPIRSAEYLERKRQRQKEYNSSYYVFYQTMLKKHYMQCSVEGCSERATTVDHKLGIAEGGKSEPGNLQGMCSTHNSSKGGVLGNQLRKDTPIF